MPEHSLELDYSRWMHPPPPDQHVVMFVLVLVLILDHQLPNSKLVSVTCLSKLGYLVLHA